MVILNKLVVVVVVFFVFSFIFPFSSAISYKCDIPATSVIKSTVDDNRGSFDKVDVDKQVF